MEKKIITTSSQVKEIAYDEERLAFQVVYKNDKRYEYTPVPKELWEQAQTAESIGKFVNEKIKPHLFTIVS